MNRLKALVLCTALLIPGCSHLKFAPVVPYDETEKVLVAAMLAGQTADYFTTSQALAAGCTEVNPLLGESPSDGTLAAVKLLSTGLTLWRVNRTESHSERKFLLGFSTLLGFGAAGYNSSLDCH